MSEFEKLYDGKRYTVGLEKPKEPNVYLDFFETDDLTAAKNECIDAVSETHGRAIIWDRHDIGIVFRHSYLTEGTSEVKDDKKSKKSKRK